MTLYYKASGDSTAPTLIMLHGWGMHSGVWQAWLPLLEPHFRVICVDLPGMGQSTSLLPRQWTLDQLALLVKRTLEKLLDKPALWLGWSLGGSVAAELARQWPERVAGLITLASNPCFVQRDNYAAAMPADTFQQFQRDLQQDWLKTLNRFVMLMAQGDPDPRAMIRQLKSVLALYKSMPPSGLAQALELLKDDYRPIYQSLHCPQLHLLGGADALVPASVVGQHPAAGCCRVLGDCGHLPFLTRAELSAELVLEFQRELARD